jgi:hypothetical protein
MIFKGFTGMMYFLRVLYDAEKISYNFEMGSLSNINFNNKTPSMPPSGWFEIVM